ncbi:hypothetical protein VOLCADRAFT_94033 [Volvox carteri f. nagariensis]|uniref:Uncharacterized protein n=1 Tax=Volvox carteri f. nagariensis TaxID=3068 RepID=D8U3R2_VOLCA|nr:uncharacterized protein VOLCADRAFT_94033 [Volvox carteri f. nagariensis]EFJ45654.1 hypothetical protein VOLCADRAFT_94033 [Volvox carteri f. nagariensis]|eukprot:XP_002953344.1 hypothetical protein VOLCADRAFT_94033 [Volvox carteri f. nagariensis]
MGRIEALTRALNSLRKVSVCRFCPECERGRPVMTILAIAQVGIRTRTESEDGDGFGRWAGQGAADKQIGTSKATVYASLAGRNRASDVWRQKSQYDDEYQRFLATTCETSQQESGKRDIDEATSERLQDQRSQEVYSQQQQLQQLQQQLQQQQQQKRKMLKLPSKQKSQSHIDTDIAHSKRWARHSSVTLYAMDTCDPTRTTTPRQIATPGAQESGSTRAGGLIVCDSSLCPSSFPYTPEYGNSTARLSPTVSGSGCATPRQALPSPIVGHVTRTRSSIDNAAAFAWIAGSAGSAATAASAAAAAQPAAAPPSGTAFGGGHPPSPSVLCRSSTNAVASDFVGGASTSSAGGASWSNSSGGGGGISAATGGGGFLRRQGSILNTADAAVALGATVAATATPVCGACNSSSSSSVGPGGAVSGSVSVVRLPSLRQVSVPLGPTPQPQQQQQQPQQQPVVGYGFGRVLRPATCGVSSTTIDGARQQHQPQPPPTPPPTQHVAQLASQQQSALQQTQQQTHSQKAGGGSEQPQPRHQAAAAAAAAGGDSPDIHRHCREQQAAAAAAAHPAAGAPPPSGRRSGSTTGLPSCTTSPALLYSMAAPAAPPSAPTAQQGLLPRGFSAQSLMAMFDAGDLSYCNPDCDDEMAQILDELVQSNRVRSGSGGSFTRGTGAVGRPPSSAGLSYLGPAAAAAGGGGGGGGGRGGGVPPAAPYGPRDVLGPMAASSGKSVLVGSVAEPSTSPSVTEAGSLPVILASSGGAGGGACSGRRGSAVAASGSYPGGGGGVSNRGSDSLLPRLPGSGAMYGSGSAVGGAGGHPGLHSGLSASTSAAAAVVAAAATAPASGMSSPCASPRSFRRSSNTSYGIGGGVGCCGSVGGGGSLLGDLDTRAVLETTDEAAVAVAASCTPRYPGPGSFRRSSQLLLQAAGRRTSSGLSTNTLPPPQPPQLPQPPTAATSTAAAAAATTRGEQTRDASYTVRSANAL